MKRYPILRLATQLLLPVIILFALYVQFHGDYGPGSGFQAGVIFAAVVVPYGWVSRKGRKPFQNKLLIDMFKGMA